jgi:DNA modification methylase
MHVRRVAIHRINPAPHNPRRDLRPEDPEYAQLMRSLDEFGLVEPLIWNSRTGNLVGGHQRYKLLVARGATSVPVSVVDLPLEREKVLNLALNKVQGRWDEDKLAALLTELTQLPDIDLDVTGFEPPEIERLTAPPDPLGPQPEEIDLEQSAQLDPVTKVGELIELGAHRLLCGDATQPRELDRLMQGERADILFSDPPYNASYSADNRPTDAASRRSKRAWSGIRNDNLARTQYRAWFSRVASNIVDALRPGAPFYLWHGHAQFGLLHDVLSELGFHPSCVLTWAKESFSPGFSDYQQATEFCLYGWRLGARHPWYGPKNASTLWSVHRDRVQTYQHPTTKALELADRALRHSSRAGEVVLDPFLGSGTTLIAAARLGRRCFGLEIEPKYCDVVVRRFIALVGEGAAPADLVRRYAMPKAAS